MGGLCSGGTKPKPDDRVDVGVGGSDSRKSGFYGRQNSAKSYGRQDERNSRSFTPLDDEFIRTTAQGRYNSGELLLNFSRELKPSTPARGRSVKDSQKSSIIGKAGAITMEKAVEVLDTLGSSMSTLNFRNGFGSGIASRGNIISVLAFEVANTITKSSNLFQSLSEENVKFLKKEILQSEGVQQLVSINMEELLSIAASDKREEIDVFVREVIRFGDLCKDPQWHNLGRYFSILDSEDSDDKLSREESEMAMQELTTLAQHTSELYHELNAMDRFEQDYQQRLEEVESLHLPKKGESLSMLQSELKHQKKLVRSLKKKSLWSKSLEEVMEKLVDTAAYLHRSVIDAFGSSGNGPPRERPGKSSQRLGEAGLALHYANVIQQIDNIASRPTFLPPNTRDNLYHGLPPYVKTALRSRLPLVDNKEQTAEHVKAEMEKTLHWLVPVATNTTKAHQGFGWIGEWANTGNEFGKKSGTQNNLIRLQTLYHADKLKTEHYILELVTWLHRLMHLANRDHDLKAVPLRLPTRKGLIFHTQMRGLFSLNHSTSAYSIQLSGEDIDLLNKVCKRRLVPGISKSQEFPVPENRGKFWALSRSTGSSPRAIGKRQNMEPQNLLDVMDGLPFHIMRS